MRRTRSSSRKACTSRTAGRCGSSLALRSALAEPLRLSFGNAAADYQRGRPGWPDEVAEVGGLPRDADVLELGAGTGERRRVVAERFARGAGSEQAGAVRARM